MGDIQKTQKPRSHFGISYNAPVILTFTLLSTGILAIGQLIPGFVSNYFTVPPRGAGFNIFSLQFFRLFSHALGHASWSHLIGNFTFILLIGPILEEKYGSGLLLLMMFITATVTGILNVLFFPNGLLGASGIVFMLILLSSVTNYKTRKVPLTFILIVLLYVGQEVYRAIFDPNNNISEFAHIMGGFCGGFFGFFFRGKKSGQNSNQETYTSGE